MPTHEGGLLPLVLLQQIISSTSPSAPQTVAAKSRRVASAVGDGKDLTPGEHAPPAKISQEIAQAMREERRAR